MATLARTITSLWRSPREQFDRAWIEAQGIKESFDYRRGDASAKDREELAQALAAVVEAAENPKLDVSDVEPGSPGGAAALALCCSQPGLGRAVASLLARGADPSASASAPSWPTASMADRPHMSTRAPLAQAAIFGAIDAISALAAAGADAAARDSEGHDPLSALCELSDVAAAPYEAAKALIAAGALSGTEPYGAAALRRAMGSLSSEVARALFDAGVEPGAKDERGRDAMDELFDAIDRRRSIYVPSNTWRAPAVALLTSWLKAGGDALAPRTWSLAARCARAQMWRSVAELGKAGVDISWAQLGGRTFLAAAQEDEFHPTVDRAQIVDMLLGAGADPRVKNDDGSDALECAVRRLDAASVTSLLGAGMDPNARVRDGSALLHVATKGGGSRHGGDVVEALAKAGADMDAACPQGWTALHWAAAAGGDVARSLVKNGADPKIKDGEGRMPGDIAAMAMRAAHPDADDQEYLWRPLLRLLPIDIGPSSAGFAKAGSRSQGPAETKPPAGLEQAAEALKALGGKVRSARGNVQEGRPVPQAPSVFKPSLRG